jgi:hypothetical protein
MNIFAKPKISYKKELSKKLDDFIYENEKKFWTKDEAKRAIQLLQIIRNLIEIEHLNETQLLWRIHSYARMQWCDGPLKFSPKLRAMIIHHMGVFLRVAVKDVETVTQRMTQELCETQALAASVLATPVAFPSYGDASEVRIDAISECVRKSLALRSAAAKDRYAEDVNRDVSHAMVTAIDKYIEGAKGKFWKWSGVTWAKELKHVIEHNWSQVQGLNDFQIAMRILENARMPRGEGLFRTSDDCRREVINSLLKSLKVDVNAVEERINALMQVPEGHIYTSSVAVPYYRDRDEVTLEVKADFIKAKLISKDQEKGYNVEMKNFASLSM